MSSVVVHFPDGHREFRYPAEKLNEGDVIWYDGKRYRVISTSLDDHGNALALVEPAPEDLATT